MAPELEGVILEDGNVLAENDKIYHLPKRGADKEGYSEVLIDAESVGGSGFFQRQSIKPYIGMKVVFYCMHEDFEGFSYTIISKNKKINQKI